MEHLILCQVQRNQKVPTGWANQRKRKQDTALSLALSVTADSCSSVYPACKSVRVCVCRCVYAMHAIWVNNIVTAVGLVRFALVCSLCLLPILNGNLNVASNSAQGASSKSSVRLSVCQSSAKWRLIIIRSVSLFNSWFGISCKQKLPASWNCKYIYRFPNGNKFNFSLAAIFKFINLYICKMVRISNHFMLPSSSSTRNILLSICKHSYSFFSRVEQAK